MIEVDLEMFFGVPNREHPLVAGPTQASPTMCLYLWSDDPSREVLLLRTQTLTAHARSMNKDNYISWNELGKDATMLGLPNAAAPTRAWTPRHYRGVQ